MSRSDEQEQEEIDSNEDAESGDAETSELDEEEFDDDLEAEEAEGFEDEFESDDELKAVDDALTHKDQNARALAIRRAIEERLEAKRLSKDLDYLDLDLDSDD